MCSRATLSYTPVTSSALENAVSIELSGGLTSEQLLSPELFTLLQLSLTSAISKANYDNENAATEEDEAPRIWPEHIRIFSVSESTLRPSNEEKENNRLDLTEKEEDQERRQSLVVNFFVINDDDIIRFGASSIACCWSLLVYDKTNDM